AIAGSWCDAAGIFTVSASGVESEVPQTLGFQCLCECANPGSPYVQIWQRIPSPGSYTATWDARQLVMYSEPYDCSQHGWPGGMVQQQQFGVRQPVGPGRYRISYDVLHELGDAGVYCYPSGAP